MTARFEAFLADLTLPQLATYQRLRAERDRAAISDAARWPTEAERYPGASWLPEGPDSDYAELLYLRCEQVAADEEVIAGLLAEKAAQAPMEQEAA